MPVISFDCFENFINLAIHKTLLLPPAWNRMIQAKEGPFLAITDGNGPTDLIVHR